MSSEHLAVRISALREASFRMTCAGCTGMYRGVQGCQGCQGVSGGVRGVRECTGRKGGARGCTGM